MKQIVSAKEAVKDIKSGSSLMVGGFLSCGAPNELVDALIENGVNDLTLICNDTTFAGVDKGKLISEKRVKKVITTHIGTNIETGRQFNAGEIEVELVPMGTFVERIRAKGTGLGGILTPTGVGTVLEENKKVMEINGKKFIFEPPIGADVALIYGTKVDKFGNVAYHGTTRNCNTVMATAADHVVVQADELVDVLDPDEVVIPGIFIDSIVVKEGDN